MQKVLVFSESRASQQDICKMIERQMRYQVFTASDQASALAQIETRIFNLIVVEQSTINKDSLVLINNIKNSSYSFPIIIIGDKIELAVQTAVNALVDTHFLARPITDKSLLGLMRKLLISKRVPKQVFRRFNTNQMAMVEELGTGANLLTSMYNLSQGGAYCEFESPTAVSVGDLIRLKVVLDDTNNEYTFNAKIVWTTPKGKFSGRFGMGFKFVNAKDTYRSMLSGS